MLRKMYSENINEIRDFHRQKEISEGVGSKILDFQFYWNALSRNKWLIALFTALMTALAIIFALSAVPVYEARATLLLESQKANIISIKDLVNTEQGSADYYGTQYAILKSRTLSERVLNHLVQEGYISQSSLSEVLSSDSDGSVDAPESGDESVLSSGNTGVVNGGAGLDLPGTDSRLFHSLGSSRYNQLVNQFRKTLTVNPVLKTKLVTISYESPDPEFSALVANAIANQYIESTVEQRKEQKVKASEWMDTRIQELKLELEKSEDALLAFKKNNELIDLNGDVGRLDEQQLLYMTGELEKARSELANARDVYLTTQRYRRSSPNLLRTLPYVKNDESVRSISSELVASQRRISSLRTRYGVKHPVIVDAESAAATLRATLQENIERAVLTFENNYQLLQSRVNTLESSVAQSKVSIHNQGGKRVTLDALEREVEVNRDQYNRLFDRIIEVRTTDGLDEANAVVAEAAWVPTNPVKPNKTLIVALVALGSLLLASIFSFIKEYFDDTINRKADIEKRLNSRVLGAIPLVGRKSGKRGFVESMFLKPSVSAPVTPVEASRKSDTFMEAVYSCRTAVSLEDAGEHGKGSRIILVTSSVPGEGRTTLALNLAYAFGQLERTLLIDCDLRKPSIAAALGMPANDVGLTNLLTEKSIKPGSIKFGVMGAFDCMTSGPVPSNSLDLLASSKFATGLEALGKSYDRIIIDSAPVQVVSDAVVLGQLVDKVLCVVKSHDTPIKVVDNTLSRLAAAHASVGICLSQVDIAKFRSFGDMNFQKAGPNYRGSGKYFTQVDRIDQGAPARLNTNAFRA